MTDDPWESMLQPRPEDEELREIREILGGRFRAVVPVRDEDENPFGKTYGT